MILGNTIRVIHQNLRNGYFAQNKTGYQILSPSIQNYINLYCKVHNGKITAAVEVYEDPCTRHEKILTKFGNYNTVINHFSL